MRSLRFAGLGALFTALLASPPVWAAWIGTTAAVSQPQALNGPSDPGTDFDSCADLTWRAGPFKQRWYNYAGPNSAHVPILSFKIANASGGLDSLVQLYVHSMNERANAIDSIFLYRDEGTTGTPDTAHYFDASDVLVKAIPVSTAFQTNDSILFSGLGLVISHSETVWFHLTVNMNPDAIAGNSTYNGTGVMVEVRADRVLLNEAGTRRLGPAASLTPACPPSPLAGVTSAGDIASAAGNRHSIIIDNQAPSCASMGITLSDLFCSNTCDGGNSVISLGDSMLINLALSVTDIATDSNVTGWPKVYIKEFSTFTAPQSMYRNSSSTFSYVRSPLDYLNIPTVSAVANPIDIPAGFYYLIAETRDVAGNMGRCSTLVLNPIDTRKPAITNPPTFSLYYDANANGIANPGDTVRVYVDMSNEPFVEVCSVTTTLYGWYVSPLLLTLADNAGDRRFAAKHKIQDGILDCPPGAWQVSIQVHVADNACNEDSALAALSCGVDNIPPVCDCPHQGDMDGSDAIDVQDVLAVIRVAFLNGADVQDAACPNTRGDVDNNTFVDVQDVLYLIRTAFLNGPDPVDPCNP